MVYSLIYDDCNWQHPQREALKRLERMVLGVSTVMELIARGNTAAVADAPDTAPG